MNSIEAWLIEQGLYGAHVGALLDGFSSKLLAEGIPLLRSYIALPTVSASARVSNHVWLRGSSVAVERVGHEREPTAFARSPFASMLDEGVSARRWRLDRPDRDYAIFSELRSLGATDYLARLMPFNAEGAPALRGVAASFATDRPEGFTDGEVARIDAVLPLLVLAAYRMTLFDLAIGVLDTYVGLSAGRRVMSGTIQRGAGETLSAALLFADLRGFTALADRAGAALIARLDEHLEAMAEPVIEHGGEVLKFMGDGLLAAFPIASANGPAEACANAVAAAEEALRRNQRVNLDRPGETPLALDIALHCGDVFYGNIGTAGRMDFTIIGPAVNEVGRMEALCSTLACDLVMSADVARLSGRPARSLGRHALRGLAEERELFTLA